MLVWTNDSSGQGWLGFADDLDVVCERRSLQGRWGVKVLTPLGRLGRLAENRGLALRDD